MLSITCVEDLVIYTWALLYFLKSICIAVLSWQRGVGKIIKSNLGWLCHSRTDELASNPLFFFFPLSENKYFLLHSSSVYQELNLSSSGRCLWARTHKLSSGNSSSRFVIWITFTADQQHLSCVLGKRGTQMHNTLLVQDSKITKTEKRDTADEY